MLGERESLGVVVVGAGLEVALTRTFPALFRLYVRLAWRCRGRARGACCLCCALVAVLELTSVSV
jgi:hypothetical protein